MTIDDDNLKIDFVITMCRLPSGLVNIHKELCVRFCTIIVCFVVCYCCVFGLCISNLRIFYVGVTQA